MIPWAKVWLRPMDTHLNKIACVCLRQNKNAHHDIFLMRNAYGITDCMSMHYDDQ